MSATDVPPDAGVAQSRSPTWVGAQVLEPAVARVRVRVRIRVNLSIQGEQATQG